MISIILAIVLVGMIALIIHAYGRSQIITAIFVLVLLIAWGAKGCSNAREEAEAARQARLAAEQAAARQAATTAQAQIKWVEVLKPISTNTTPFSTFIGWDYVMWTDGGSFCVKFKNLNWVEYPGKGDFETPAGFKPGKAEFISADSSNPHIRVWVYEKVQVAVPK
jgi:hypothetical protein